MYLGKIDYRLIGFILDSSDYYKTLDKDVGKVDVPQRYGELLPDSGATHPWSGHGQVTPGRDVERRYDSRVSVDFPSPRGSDRSLSRLW